MFVLWCRFLIGWVWDDKCRRIDVFDEFYTTSIGKVIFESDKVEGLSCDDFKIIAQLPMGYGWIDIDMDTTCAQVYRKCGFDFCGQHRAIFHVVPKDK